MTRLLAASVVLAWLLALVPRLCAAEDSVALSIADCAGASGEAVSRLVALELSPQLAVLPEPALAATTRATLRCSAQQATITVQDVHGSAPQQLTLSLLDTAQAARPRLLALAIAELVATSRLEQPAAPPPPERAAVAEPAPVALALPGARAWSWLAGGVLRAASPTVWSPMLTLGSAYDWGALAGQGDLAFEWGEQRGQRASVKARVLSLSIAPMLPLLRGRCSLALGAGVRAGWAWLSARAREDGVAGKGLSGAYVAPVARGAVAFALTQRWSTRIDLELGYVVKSVRGLDADGDPLLKLAGLRSAASLGLAVSLR